MFIYSLGLGSKTCPYNSSGRDKLLCPNSAGDGSREVHPSAFIYLTLAGSFGTDRSITQWEKSRASRLESWKMLTGRVTKLVKLSVKYFKEDKHFIYVGGCSLIVVQLKWSSDRLFIIPLNSGIILKFEQLSRLRTVRDSIIADMLGRLVRDLQNVSCKWLSLLSCEIDGWISTKLQQLERFSFSRFGIPEKSGVLVRLE